MSAITAHEAKWRLSRLQRCQEIKAYRAGDDELICANDGFELVPFGRVLRHSSVEIKAMVDAAAQWPSWQ